MNIENKDKKKKHAKINKQINKQISKQASTQTSAGLLDRFTRSGFAFRFYIS